MSIDPRLVERRKTVAEDKAKRNVSRLLKFLLLVVLVGALVWLAFSPWLSISQVDTTGIAASPAHSVLVDEGVTAGTPMFQVDESETEAALLASPWIATADVSRQWPNRVTVEVVERYPVAWTNTASGWTWRALDGVALPSDPPPDETMAWVDIPDMTQAEIDESTDMTGALEFIEALPPNHRSGAVVTRHDGELWATVNDFQVRLGRSVEMTEKALSLDALLDQDLPAGSILVLIAPTNPAVSTPAPISEASDESGGGEAGEDQEAGGGDETSAEETSGDSADEGGGDGDG